MSLLFFVRLSVIIALLCSLQIEKISCRVEKTKPSQSQSPSQGRNQVFDAETVLGGEDRVETYQSETARRLCSVYLNETNKNSHRCCTVEYELDIITEASLAEILDPQIASDSEYLKYYTTFTTIRSPSYSHTSPEQLHEAIDKFMGPRPWFTHVYRHNCHIFQRISMEMYPYFQLFRRRGYLPQSVCDTKFYMVSNHVDDTWGNRIINMHSEFSHRKPFVFHIWGNRGHYFGGKDPEGAMFTTSAACKKANKWECLFLPMTNCTVPLELANCNSDSCLPPPWTHGIYTSANADGKMINPNDYNKYKKTWDDLESSYDKKDQQLFNYPDTIRKPYEMYMSKNSLLSTEKAMSVKEIGSESWASMTAMVFGLAFRMTAKFRMHVEEAVSIFRENSHSKFDESSKCIALHIRKNDRNIPGVDMVKWCANCTKRDEKTNRKIVDPDDRCAKAKPNPVDYSRWMDMGCQADAPYGSVNLEHYLNASKVLDPDVRHLFVMTDDPATLHLDIVRYQQSHRNDHNIMHIHTLSAKSKHRDNDMSNAYSNSVDYFASVEVARKCTGFVAHFGSAASRMVARSMCFSHADKFYQCPSFYDVGGVHEIGL